MSDDKAYNDYLIHSVGNMKLPIEELQDVARRIGADLSGCTTLREICETVSLECSSFVTQTL